MCDLEQADTWHLHADPWPATAPWLRPGTLISPEGAQAAHPLLSLWVGAGVGVVLNSRKMAIEQWSVCFQGFSSPHLFGHSTVELWQQGDPSSREAAARKGSQHQALATLFP